MPSQSIVQQQAMAIALAARNGKFPVYKLEGAAKDLYYSKISNKDLEDFASTQHKDLPQRAVKKTNENNKNRKYLYIFQPLSALTFY